MIHDSVIHRPRRRRIPLFFKVWRGHYRILRKTNDRRVSFFTSLHLACLLFRAV
jgi:hypothetical protein